MTARQTGQPTPDPADQTADQPETGSALPVRERDRTYFPRAWGITPYDYVQSMMDAVAAFGLLHAAVKRGIFELLSNEELTADELAAACNAKPSYLWRVMNWLHANSFVALRDDRYRLTDLGRGLTAAAERSQRDAVLVTGHPYWLRAIGDLDQTFVRGYPLPEDGLFPYSHLADDDELSYHFNRFMLSRSHAIGVKIANLDDYAHVRTVCDIGGGLGGILAKILHAHPHVTGVLLERPEVAADAHTYFSLQDLDGRVKVIAGDMFDGIPAADRYLLSSVAHNLGDVNYLSLLTQLSQAMAANDHADLLIAEGMLPSAPGRPSRWYDIDARMMAMFPDGRVRSEDEHRRLLEHAGLRAVRSLMLPDDQTLLIAQHAPALIGS
ncbi:methyltransferase [Nonomuraea bangladeshensis]|uniref:methyltransferase n=1 Tax=Nonomuraea bangladeshensis TaxID=404385 RepID=UPI0031D746A9